MEMITFHSILLFLLLVNRIQSAETSRNLILSTVVNFAEFSEDENENYFDKFEEETKEIGGQVGKVAVDEKVLARAKSPLLKKISKALIRDTKNSSESNNNLLIDIEWQGRWMITLKIMENSFSSTRSRSLIGLASLSCCFKDPQGALIRGIKNKNSWLVAAAIENGANIFAIEKMSSNLAPIEYAVTLGAKSLVRRMLKLSTNYNSDLFEFLLRGLLIRAVQADQLEVVKMLTQEFGATYTVKSYLIHQAVMHHASLDLLKYLISYFWTVSEIRQVFGSHGDTLLHLSIRYNNPKAFRYLFEVFPDTLCIPNNEEMNPLEYLASTFKYSFLESILEKSPEFFEKWVNHDGNLLLHLAVLRRNLPLVKALVDSFKFPINVPNAFDELPLFMAYRTEHNTEMVKFFISKNVNVFEKCFLGKSFLYHVVKDHKYELLRFISDHLISTCRYRYQIDTVLSKITAEIVECRNWKALDVLLQSNQAYFIYPLQLSKGNIAEITLRESIWNTPNLLSHLIYHRQVKASRYLHEAIKRGLVNVVKAAIRVGVDLQVVSRSNKLPFEIALETNQPEMLKLFLKFDKVTVTDSFSLDNFVFLLLNGGSFCPNSEFKIEYKRRSVLLKLFAKYFETRRAATEIDHKELALLCMQFELFIYHQCNGQHLVPGLLEILNQTYENQREISAKFADLNPITKTLLESQIPELAKVYHQIRHLNEISVSDINELQLENEQIVQEFISIIKSE